MMMNGVSRFNHYYDTVVKKNDGATMIHNSCRLANKRYFIYIYIFYHNNPHYFQFKTVATIHFYEIFNVAIAMMLLLDDDLTMHPLL